MCFIFEKQKERNQKCNGFQLGTGSVPLQILLISILGVERNSFFKDTAEGIANELLSAGLIVGEDLVAMAGKVETNLL
jgi:Oxidative-stress-responsive kinase 1 C-terminal domain